MLAQLRTGMIQLSRYLHQIGGAESAQCACGQHVRQTGRVRIKAWNPVSQHLSDKDPADDIIVCRLSRAKEVLEAP